MHQLGERFAAEADAARSLEVVANCFDRVDGPLAW
jgi:hypothetical protein